MVSVGLRSEAVRVRDAVGEHPFVLVLVLPEVFAFDAVEPPAEVVE